MNETLRRLAEEYAEFNGTSIVTLHSPPTALEFSRLVHISRPVLIHGFEIPSVRLWSDEYLSAALGDAKISVATTPDGRADAITAGPDGTQWFVEPAVEQMTMSDLLEKLLNERADSDVHYLQSQNGNVYSSTYFTDGSRDSEFLPLRQDIPSEIDFCSQALGKSPDAVNIWMGSRRSVTSIHSGSSVMQLVDWSSSHLDPYENIYYVVRGTKHFTLLPPTESFCLQERLYPHATWTRPAPDAPLTILSSAGAPPVRWASITNPDNPANLPVEAHPVQITVHAGEMLYLPPGWWHHVQQDDRTIALNWWYDCEMRGIVWPLLSVLRGDPQASSSATADDN
ncbi:Jmjc domain-containing protein 7 [Mycena kentingensis (nom. inval.)]|nr:Jmjc domain-containing protein 7 [Mycena kentingensis (nom. inval.)]